MNVAILELKLIITWRMQENGSNLFLNYRYTSNFIIQKLGYLCNIKSTNNFPQNPTEVY